ncbi:hypothetical protein [Arenimonas sp.]|jgi:hypothetical protein|uniref:hypothetical protein n=1 Tax=Arenimonas sp. TaxID=1872635 RepID=UPI0037C099D2
MADYNSSGLWSPDFDIDLESLKNSLSSELKIYLHLWIEFYNNIIDWDDPNNEKWDPRNNIDYEKSLNAIEILVFNKVKAELADKYDLIFVSWNEIKPE